MYLYAQYCVVLCFMRCLYSAGSGGNGHAADYFKQTGFPVVVKLGTITPEGAGELPSTDCFHARVAPADLIVTDLPVFLKNSS